MGKVGSPGGPARQAPMNLKSPAFDTPRTCPSPLLHVARTHHLRTNILTALCRSVASAHLEIRRRFVELRELKTELRRGHMPHDIPWLPTHQRQAELLLKRVNDLQEQMWCYSESGASFLHPPSLSHLSSRHPPLLPQCHASPHLPLYVAAPAPAPTACSGG